MHNEGLSLTFCLVLVAATVAVVQAYPAEIGEDEQPLVGLDEKRGWNNFHSGYGKRGWNNFAGGYGKRSFDYDEEEPLYEMEAEKRAWNSGFQGGLGKRAWNSGFNGGLGKRAWNSFAGGYGKRGWNNFAGGYGKRAWNSFAGGYGKRSAELPEEVPENLEYEMETKRGWNTGMGAWGKRKKRSTNDSSIAENEANNTTGQRITRNGRKYILLTPAQIRFLLAKTKRTKGWLALRGMWG